MKSYCIYGASGHGKVIIEILENLGYPVKELFDDDISRKVLLGYKVTSDPGIFNEGEINWIIAVGDNRTREKIVNSHSLNYGSAIDQNTRISRRVGIAEGTVVMPGVTINSSTVIGRHSIINTNCSIDHDCILGDFVHVSPNATLCGGVKIGEGTHVGAGAVIIPGIEIGKWVRIGAGAVIIRNVTDGETVVGNPGRVLKAGQKKD